MSASDPIAVGRRVLAAEAEALNAQARALDDAFAQAIDLLFQAKGRIICTGMGKSGHVARKIAATFASTGSSAFFVHPAEASHGDLGMIGETDVILALSKSGEVRELADILAYATRFKIPLIGVTAVGLAYIASALIESTSGTPARRTTTRGSSPTAATCTCAAPARRSNTRAARASSRGATPGTATRSASPSIAPATTNSASPS